MSEQTDNLTNLLVPFGLSGEESKIYLELLQYGKLSALQISRKLKMGRTKVYRILDSLIAKEMVINEFDEIGFKFAASEPAKFELLVNQREGEIQALKQALPKVRSVLEQRMGSKQPGSKVRYYQGERGLTQVNFNLLNAKGGICSFEVAQADVYMTHEDAEIMRQAIVDQQIKIKTITNQTEIAPFTKITGLIPLCEIRNVPMEVFKVKADIFIYNDIYALCHYLKDGDVFCVEMYNQELADMQRQLFECLWTNATPLTFIGHEGEARL